MTINKDNLDVNWNLYGFPSVGEKPTPEQFGIVPVDSSEQNVSEKSFADILIPVIIFVVFLLIYFFDSYFNYSQNEVYRLIHSLFFTIFSPLIILVCFTTLSPIFIVLCAIYFKFINPFLQKRSYTS